MGGKKKAPAVEGPAIFAAIDRGDEDEVIAMLENDKDKTLLNLKNRDGWSPLIACSYCGEADLVALMLKAGADINATCRDGDTALHYAAAQGHADIIQLLAKAGAKLECKDKDGETPYNVAGKNLKIRKLIQQLIDAKVEDSEEANAGGDDEDEEWEEVEAEETAK